MNLGRIWTFGRAVRLGLIGATIALALWPAYALLQEQAKAAFIAALALTAFCGASILAFSLIDWLMVSRARSVRPARVFDVMLGLAIAVPSALALHSLL